MAILLVAMLALAVPIGIAASDAGEEYTTGSSPILAADPVGSGTQADPYVINMLVGDTFEYRMATNLSANFAITSGNLSSIGLSLVTDTIKGTATVGKQLICVTATASEGPSQTATQYIKFNNYNVLTLSGTPTASWNGQAFSATFTISDVDPDATGETTLTLNTDASNAGYTISKVSETSWTLARTAESNVAGTTHVVVTATTSAGGISQSKTLESDIITYSDVGFTSTPDGHVGDGLSVWLVKGEGSWEYTPTASPEGSVITAQSSLPAGITFADGKLTVSKANAFDTQTITLTATSNAGGSAKTATQTLTVKVWDQIDYETAPSVSNITGTVDGRTYSASVVADNYSNIVWDMGDGTTYNGVTSVKHEYTEAGLYTVRVTVSDDRGQSASTTSAVYIASEGENPAPGPGGDDNPGGDDSTKTDDTNWNGIISAIVAAIGLIIFAVGLYYKSPVIIAIGVIILVAGAIGCIYFYTDLFSGIVSANILGGY